MIPYCNKRAGLSEQEHQEQAEISSDEDTLLLKMKLLTLMHVYLQ